MTTKKHFWGKALSLFTMLLLLATILSPLALHYDSTDKRLKPRRIVTHILSRVHLLPSDAPAAKMKTSPVIFEEVDKIGSALDCLQEKLKSGEANREETDKEVKSLKEMISTFKKDMTDLQDSQKTSAAAATAAAAKKESSSYQLKVNPPDDLLHPFSFEFTKPKEEKISIYKNFDATMFIIVYVLTITFFTILTVVSIKGLRRQEQRDLYERGKKEFWLMLKTSSNREPYQEQFMQEMMRLYFNKKDE